MKSRVSAALVLVLASVAGGCRAQPAGATDGASARPVTVVSQEPTVRPGPWTAPNGLLQTPLWPGDAPDTQGFNVPAESVLVAQTPEALGGDTSEAAQNVSAPTMTVFPARGTPNGTAIVVFPGGGFKAVVLTLQGTEICDWITARGVACVLVKYRVPKTSHHYEADCDCGVEPDRPRALQDAQRAIRLVRSRAGALGVDPARIGVMGFSAGGYLAVQTSNIFEPVYQRVDAVDDVSSRPDFAIAFYPGHLCRPGGRLDPAIHVTANTPPTFIVAAWDDPTNEICNTTLYARSLDVAGVSTEVHIFAKGGHAFALRTPEQRLAAWPDLLDGWLRERGLLDR